MKTTLNIIAGLIYLILLSIAICNPERLVWKIVFTGILLFIGWIIYELYNAKEMPKDYLE